MYSTGIPQHHVASFHVGHNRRCVPELRIIGRETEMVLVYRNARQPFGIALVNISKPFVRTGHNNVAADSGRRRRQGDSALHTLPPRATDGMLVDV